MKNLTLLFLILCFTAPIFAQNKVVLDRGTVLKITSLSDMGSKINQSGDIVHFTVSEDIYANDELVIPAGSEVTGTVQKSKRARLAGTNAKFDISVDYLRLPNGNNIHLRSNKELDNVEDKQILVIGAAVLANPLFLLFKGKDVTIPQGTPFEVYLDEDIIALD